MMLLAAVAISSTVIAQIDIATYSAIYDVHYKGRRVGTSEFSVRWDSATRHYHYASNTRVKGLLRLISPKPVIEESEFLLTTEFVQPLNYLYEDGSRKGDDNFRIAFDWTGNTAEINGDSGPVAITLSPNTLDRASLQVAIMRDLAAGSAVGPYLFVDDDGLKTYEYSEEEGAEADTGMGQIAVRRFRQQRQGSSRSTILWMAPSLRYLPVRIEQIRNGEIETVFALDTVEFTDPE